MKTQEKLTSAELGKLWATYMGNSMTRCIITYFIQCVEDNEIKDLLTHAKKLNEKFINEITFIFEKEHIPIPTGFSEKEDVILKAPKLYEDAFYVHYLKYAAKAGFSIYNIAIPLVFREDIREFFKMALNETVAIMEKIKDILMNKGLIIKPPILPYPEQSKIVKKDFLNGYIGYVRPLHALEVTHLYDNIENNATSKALILGFSQVAKDPKVRKLFEKGKDITDKVIEKYMEQLHHASLPSPSYLDHLVTTSTFAPFSDKLMLFHKMDMFSMKLRAFGNSIAVNGRHDIGFMYTKSLMSIASFVEDATKLMIENGWMEQPPEAPDHQHLS